MKRTTMILLITFSLTACSHLSQMPENKEQTSIQLSGNPSPAVSPINTITSAQSDTTASTSTITPLQSDSTSPSSTITIIDQWHNVYEGSLNDEKFIMDIYRNSTTLTAFLVKQKSQQDEMKFTGEIVDDKIVLNSFENGNKVAMIEGEGSGPATDDIKCTYTSLIDNTNLPVIIHMTHATSGNSVDKRYCYDTKSVEDFVSEIKDCIVSGDKQKLSEKIRYPIDVLISNKVTTINTAEEFISSYDDVINQEFKEAITNSYTKFMFSSWRGIAFGDGNHVVGICQFLDKDTLEIYSINN